MDLNKKMIEAVRKLEEKGLVLRKSPSIFSALAESQRSDLFLPESKRTDEVRFSRCQYTLWLSFERGEQGGLFGAFFSDSLLVRGLMSFLIESLEGLTAEEIKSLNWKKVKDEWTFNGKSTVIAESVLDSLTGLIFSAAG